MAITVLASVTTAVSHTGSTAETTLGTYTLPANTLPTNGVLRITSEWSGLGGTSGTRRVRWDGTSGTIYGTQAANTASARGETYIVADNATNAQKAALNAMTAPFGNGTKVTSAVDTTNNVDIVFSIHLTNGADTGRLESYTIELIEP